MRGEMFSALVHTTSSQRLCNSINILSHLEMLQAATQGEC
jgi:hypothetical protein